MEALTQPEIVRQIVLAAYGNVHPGSYRMKQALKKAEQLLQEIHEQEIAELAEYYQVEMTDE